MQENLAVLQNSAQNGVTRRRMLHSAAAVLASPLLASSGPDARGAEGARGPSPWLTLPLGVRSRHVDNNTGITMLFGLQRGGRA